jgi:hypothetical protein
MKQYFNYKLNVKNQLWLMRIFSSVCCSERSEVARYVPLCKIRGFTEAAMKNAVFWDVRTEVSGERSASIITVTIYC